MSAIGSVRNLLGQVPGFGTAPATEPKVDSPAAPPDTDVDSTATEVSKLSSEAEIVDSNPDASPETPPTGAPPNFKLIVPEPIEKASQEALKAIIDWWTQLEPFLRKLQLQMLQMMDPYLKASGEGMAKLQKQLEPHTASAMALIKEWTAKLEPLYKQALEAAQKAIEAAKVGAYEPALVWIQQAQVAVTAHAQTSAALISSKSIEYYGVTKEWIAAQAPVLEKMQVLAMEYAKIALEKLKEWKVLLEPHVKEYLKITQQKSIEFSQKAGVEIKKFSEKAGEEIKKGAEAAKVAAEPHLAKAKVWADERKAEVEKAMEPHLRPVITWTEETGKKIEPVTKPVGEAMVCMCTALVAQLDAIYKKLEGPEKLKKAQEWLAAGGLQKWLMETMQCLCLPVQKQLNFKGAGEEYPPPVVATTVPPEAPATTAD